MVIEAGERWMRVRERHERLATSQSLALRHVEVGGAAARRVVNLLERCFITSVSMKP